MKKILIKNAVAIVATNTKLNAVDSLKLREGSFDISNNSMIIADNKIEKIKRNGCISGTGMYAPSLNAVFCP